MLTVCGTAAVSAKCQLCRLRMGVPQKYLQKRLRNIDLQVTMKYYLHLTDRMNKEADRSENFYWQIAKAELN